MLIICQTHTGGESRDWRSGRKKLPCPGRVPRRSEGLLGKACAGSLAKGRTLTALPSDSPAGKSKSMGTVSPGTPGCWGRLSHLSNNHILEMPLVIPVQGLVAFIWEAGPGEKGGRVFHKISLGIQGLASHQGMSERHWA